MCRKLDLRQTKIGKRKRGGTDAAPFLYPGTLFRDTYTYQILPTFTPSFATAPHEMAENQTLKAFIIYARDDKAFKNQPLRHFCLIVRRGYLFLFLLAIAATPLTAQSFESALPKAPPTNTPSTSSTASPDNLVLVCGGTFLMGSIESSEEQPVHSVTVSDFYMGKYEVSNAEFVKFLNAKGNQTEGGVTWINLEGKWEDEKCRIYLSGSTFKVESGYENNPVIYVSWYGASAYCQWLGGQYRLPTEAEWEYAAGNGKRHTEYSWGNGDPSGKKGGNVSDITAKEKFASWSAFENYTDGYIYTAPVGQFDANDLDLYDMSGNVWEWCSDWYDAEYYKNSPNKDPKGPTNAVDYRVLRGGSWGHFPGNCRVANRVRADPAGRNYDVGFRVVRGY